MDAWELEGEGGEFMRRLRRRGGWFLLLLLAGSGAVWAGKRLFVEAQCPRLQDTVLYAVAGGITLLALLWAALTKNDAPLVVVVSIPGLAAGILLLATLAGGGLSTVPPLQAVFCPPRICEQAQFVRSLRESGKLQAAEEAARNCLAMSPATQAEGDCQQECALQLVRVLYEKSDPRSLPAWERGREQACGEFFSWLEEARELANKYGQGDLERMVKERQSRLAEACATPTPYMTPHAGDSGGSAPHPI